jgi:hypothetical protein
MKTTRITWTQIFIMVKDSLWIRSQFSIVQFVNFIEKTDIMPCNFIHFLTCMKSMRHILISNYICLKPLYARFDEVIWIHVFWFLLSFQLVYAHLGLKQVSDMQFLGAKGKWVITYYLPVLIMNCTNMPIIEPVTSIIWVNWDQVQPWRTHLVLWGNWKDFR